MTHDYGKPSNIYAQLGSIRMSAAERHAIANLKVKLINPRERIPRKTT
jgi:hypothetical protein